MRWAYKHFNKSPIFLWLILVYCSFRKNGWSRSHSYKLYTITLSFSRSHTHTHTHFAEIHCYILRLLGAARHALKRFHWNRLVRQFCTTPTCVIYYIALKCKLPTLISQNVFNMKFSVEFLSLNATTYAFCLQHKLLDVLALFFCVI